MTDLATEAVRLLRQARRWFSPHPERADAACVQATPRDVLRWMEEVDAALLRQDQAAQAQPQGIADT